MKRTANHVGTVLVSVLWALVAAAIVAPIIGLLFGFNPWVGTALIAAAVIGGGVLGERQWRALR